MMASDRKAFSKTERQTMPETATSVEVADNGVIMVVDRDMLNAALLYVTDDSARPVLQQVAVFSVFGKPVLAATDTYGLIIVGEEAVVGNWQVWMELVPDNMVAQLDSVELKKALKAVAKPTAAELRNTMMNRNLLQVSVVKQENGILGSTKVQVERHHENGVGSSGGVFSWNGMTYDFPRIHSLVGKCEWKPCDTVFSFGAWQLERVSDVAKVFGKTTDNVAATFLGAIDGNGGGRPSCWVVETDGRHESQKLAAQCLLMPVRLEEHEWAGAYVNGGVNEHKDNKETNK